MASRLSQHVMQKSHLLRYTFDNPLQNKKSETT
jgi:hypothetical protein